MSAPRLAVRGRLADLDDAGRALLLERRPGDGGELRERVRALMDDVRRRGDEALLEMARRFDGVELEALEVPRPFWDEALDGLEAGVRSALERAAANIRRFHAAQLPGTVSLEVEEGVTLERRWSPLEAAGVYAPGGRAAYPSSVLMGAVPARAAGVAEVVVCSPPGPGGLPPAEVMAAAALGGATRLFAAGGAGAVAAMAWGCGSVPRCGAVVGPGNRWVTEAKRQVAGEVRIDSPAGPSEVLVVADGSADPEAAAAELLAQAEHDPDAAVALVTWDRALARRVEEALARRLDAAPRREVAAEALAARGAVLVADGRDEALAFARAYAAEHLALHTADPGADVEAVPTAGTVFLGGAASVAFGDYLTGANHVLPTGGAARAFSGLSVVDFLRSWTVQRITPAGAASLAADTVRLAEAEGLPAHAEAARVAAATGGRR